MSQWYHLVILTEDSDKSEVANIITAIAEERKRAAPEWEAVRPAYKRQFAWRGGIQKLITWEANDEWMD